ncbi:MAG: ATP-binding protein [Candidatus Woesebacteria bacterium]|nr:ATP-binding protein [Candidatus Woesebacteria bacterium]
MENGIIKRDIFDKLESFLGTKNIIVLHGARQVGKTHIMYFIEKFLQKRGEETHYIDLEDSRFVEILDRGVDSFTAYLKGEGVKNKVTVFIDEIQYLQDPSSFLKLIVDHHPEIQLIVSGSSSFNIKSKFSDSLVGRTVNFEIFPLSFSEFLRFKKINTSMTDKLLSLYNEYMAYGGYPKIVLDDDIKHKEIYLQQIIDTYIRKDISDLANVKDTKKFNDLLKVLASFSGQLLKVSELSDICGLALQTINSYLEILEETYIIKLVSPFSTSAKVEIAKTPKIFFYDTGILQMLWFKRLQNGNVGNIFETSVFSELVKKFGIENINYWRNKNMNEIDFILNKNNEILPIEVKSNFSQFKKSKINSFLEKYKIKNFYVIGLLGEKNKEYYKYPWEII